MKSKKGKKIKTRRQIKEEIRQRNIRIFITIFMALIMITSIIGFLWRSNNVERVGNYFILKYKGKKIYFHYSKDMLYDINISNDLNYLKDVKYAIITFEPSKEYSQILDLVRFELRENLEKKGITIIDGIASKDDRYNLPIFTCTNSTYAVPVIMFRISNSTKILRNNSCVIVEGKGIELMRAKDRLQYFLFEK